MKAVLFTALVLSAPGAFAFTPTGVLQSPVLCSPSNKAFNPSEPAVSVYGPRGQQVFGFYGGPVRATVSDDGSTLIYEVDNVSFGRTYTRQLKVALRADPVTGLHEGRMEYQTSSGVGDDLKCQVYEGERVVIAQESRKGENTALGAVLNSQAQRLCHTRVIPIGPIVSRFHPVFSPDATGYTIASQAFICR